MARNLTITLLAALMVYLGYELATNLPSSLSVVTSEAWGRMILADLYAGLLIFAGWAYYREPSPLVATAWSVSFLVLGNLAVLVYTLRVLGKRTQAAAKGKAT